MNGPHGSSICIREEKEAREDTVGPLHGHQGIFLSGLQIYLLPEAQLEDHAPRSDLEGALDIVTEGDHFLHGIDTADEVHAQVPP